MIEGIKELINEINKELDCFLFTISDQGISIIIYLAETALLNL